MVLAQRPKLTKEERKLPIAKYYDRPMQFPGPLERIILRHPLRPEEVPAPEDFAKLLLEEDYTGSEYGYCILPDGTGYVATYNVFQHCTLEMLDWWFPWMSMHPKNQPVGCGNLRYKVWFPYGHFDHGMKQAPDGQEYMCASEALDLLQDGDPVDNIYMHALDPLDFGVTKEQLEKLERTGVSYGISYETFDYPGMHLCMHIMRRREDGLVEQIGREWIGCGIENNRVVRVKETPLDESFLKKIVFHCTMEMLHLDDILPDIYCEYHDLPADSD